MGAMLEYGDAQLEFTSPIETSTSGDTLPPHDDSDTVRIFRELVLNWWSKEGRHSLPWRSSIDPYQILVAEFLLQKTNAEKVIPVYSEIVSEFPNIFCLADTSADELRQILKPLGLYYRATRLKIAAQTIVDKHNGHIPNTLEQLNELTGVGDYISNAILCFAYRQPRALVDTNSARVLGRSLGIPIAKRPRTDKALWLFANSLVPVDSPREYNWALIDFAHLVCTARKPQHDVCPLIHLCVFYREEVIESDRRNSRSK